MFFKFILDYESSAFTRSVSKKYTAVLKSGERFEQAKMKDDCTSLSVLAISFNFQVKRDGRKSNRATNLSPPPRLKMTDIKQNQQTTKKSKVSIILPPPPPTQMKKFSLLGKGWKRDFFYRLEKIIQPAPRPPKKSPLQKVQSSPESSPDFPTGR